MLEQLESVAAVFWRIDNLRNQNLQESAVRIKLYAIRIAFFGRDSLTL